MQGTCNGFSSTVFNFNRAQERDVSRLQNFLRTSWGKVPILRKTITNLEYSHQPHPLVKHSIYSQLAFDISISIVSSLSNARLSSLVLACRLPPILRLPLLSTPFSSSIMRRIWVWSELSIGAIDISRTARNLPQLFRCSFSNRKKFQTNLLKTIVVIKWLHV